MFHFPSALPPFFNQIKVEHLKDTTLYRPSISYLSTQLSTTMQNKVCDVNLLHFLDKWDTSKFPTKECLTLKTMVNDAVGEREAGDKGKKEVLPVCLFSSSCSLYLPAANSWVWSTVPAADLLLWLPGSRRLNPSLLSFCPLNYQFVNS